MHFKKCIYNLGDFEAFLTYKIYKLQNVSANKTAYIIGGDDNFTTLKSIKLNPLSIKYDLTPLKSNYKIIIVSNGDIYIIKQNIS